MEGKKVYAAIQAVAKAMAAKGISKSDTNSFHKYKFRGIDAVMKALSVELIAANLLLLPRVTDSRENIGDGKNAHVFITMEYDLVSTEDGSSHTIAFPGEGADNGDKSSNKAMSAAYKYAVLQTFCIPTEGVLDDSDTDIPDPPPTFAERMAKAKTALGDKYGEILETAGFGSAEEITEADIQERILNQMRKAAKSGNK